MNTFFAHLDKEWREQRRGLVALLLLAAALPFAVWTLPDGALPSSAPLGEIAALVLLVATTALLASDLVPRERAGDARGIALLARLPRGLSRALSSKALVFVVGVTATTLTAYCIGRTIDAWRGTYDPHTWNSARSTALLFAALFAPWLFVASTFVARGSWTAPVALFTTWPAWSIAGIVYVEADGATIRALVLLVNAATAFGTAHFVFAGGNDASRSTRAALRRGALALALIAATLGLPAILAMRRAVTVDPTHDSLRIEKFVVDPTGTRLWVRAYRQPEHPPSMFSRGDIRVMTVDADHGDWAFVGDTGADFSAVGPPDWLSVRRITSPIVVREPNANASPRFFDPTTARPIDSEVALTAVRSAFELPPGDWSRYGNARVEHSADRLAENTRVTDRTTGASVLLGEVADELGRPCRTLFVRGGSWVMVSMGLHVELFDPVSRTRRPAPESLTLMNRTLTPLADGRFIGRDTDGRLVAVDPDAPHVAEPIAGLAPRFEGANLHHVDYNVTAERAELPRLFTLTAADGSRAHARLLSDPPRFAGTVEQVGTNVLNVVWLDADRLLFLEDWRHIVELDFARGTRRVVFPR
jgi:hypothetical protein